MENSEDPLENDKYIQEKLDVVLEEKELKTQWLKEIEQNESMQNYFKSFNEKSVKDFIETYISTKYSWMRYGNFYKDQGEMAASKWIDLAHKHLEAILQKKLFDQQCLWRAEQIQLEGVEICFDFKVWEKDIWDCPFIETITAGDVAMYSDFLIKGEVQVEDLFELGEWQNYEEIKGSYEDDNDYDDMPEWYEYHNTRTGKSSLLLLPDIRGEKEDFYEKIYFNSKEYLDKIAESEVKRVANPNFDARPSLKTFPRDTIDYFVKTFEPRSVQLKHKYYIENSRYGTQDEETEYYEELFREVLAIKEQIPIQAHHDLREAVAIAIDQYKCNKIAENLPIAFDQYLFNKKMGFSVSKQDNFYRSLRPNWTDRFIKARVLNGEAPDLDF